MECKGIMKKILFISALYPNSSAPNMAPFNKQQLSALTDYYDINAVVPISWLHKMRRSDVPLEGLIGGVKVIYPTYYHAPVFFRKLYGLYGFYYYNSIIRTIEKLTDNNSFDLIYSSWLFPDAWVATKIARKLGLPLFASVLGSDVNRLEPNTLLARRALEVVDYASQIICVSNSLREKLIEIGGNPSKLLVLQNGVDKRIFYPMDKRIIRNELSIRSTDKVILFVGNLKKEKGLGELCHAFANLVNNHKLQNCKLVVIGNGAFMTQLKQILSELKVLDKAEIMGEHPLETIAKYMNASDVLCLPSYSEGQPNVVMEALSCHTRVVATAVGGTPDLDDGYGNLKLVPPKTVPELTRALLGMLLNDNISDKWTTFNTWEDDAAYLHRVIEMALEPET